MFASIGAANIANSSPVLTLFNAPPGMRTRRPQRDGETGPMGVTFPGSFFYKGQKVFLGFTYPNAPRGDDGQPAGVIVSMFDSFFSSRQHRM